MISKSSRATVPRESAQALGREQLGRGHRLPVRAAGRGRGVPHGDLHRVAVGVFEGALDDGDALGVDVARAAAAGLVGDRDGAARWHAAHAVAEAQRRAVVLVDGDHEVPVVRARVEEAIDLGERTLRRRHNGRVVEVRAEVEMQLEVGEPARVEKLRVRLRVLDQREDARRIGSRRDDGGREELEAHRLCHLLRAQHRAGRDGDARHRHTRELEPDLSGRRLRALEAVAEHLRQRHHALALRGRDEAGLAGEVVLVEGQDVADVGVELDEQVPEARDVEVGPVGEHALDERDEARPKGVKVFVGVVDGLGQRGHGGMPPGRQSRSRGASGDGNECVRVPLVWVSI